MGRTPSPLPPQGTRVTRTLAFLTDAVFAYVLVIVLVALVVGWIASH